jgi:acetyl-CoA acyltransferase
MRLAIAGGAESLSNVPILHSRGFSDALVAASKAKTSPSACRRVAGIRGKDFIPITPGHRRADHRGDDGAVGGEDGEAQRHPARGAGRVRARVAPNAHAGTADGRLTAEIVPVSLPPKFERSR